MEAKVEEPGEALWKGQEAEFWALWWQELMESLQGSVHAYVNTI